MEVSAFSTRSYPRALPETETAPTSLLPSSPFPYPAASLAFLGRSRGERASPPPFQRKRLMPLLSSSHLCLPVSTPLEPCNLLSISLHLPAHAKAMWLWCGARSLVFVCGMCGGVWALVTVAVVVTAAVVIPPTVPASHPHRMVRQDASLPQKLCSPYCYSLSLSTISIIQSFVSVLHIA